MTLRLSYFAVSPTVSNSYVDASHDAPVFAPSNKDAERIGAELKRWSQRPVGATNARALGLGIVILVMMLVAGQRTSEPAAAVRAIAVMFAVSQGALHFMSIGMLRGLVRAGVAGAQEAIAALRDPRRLSNLDMAALWALVALTVRFWE